jgi:hypothetical protein
MLAFLLDEDEFEVAPAVSRIFNSFEVNLTQKRSRRNQFPENPDEIQKNIFFPSGVTTFSLVVDYTGDFFLIGNDNVTTWDVFINDNFYGTDVNFIQVNTNDILRIDIEPTTAGLQSVLEYGIKLL